MPALVAALTASALAGANCPAIEGAAAILDNPASRYIIFGELHGTVQSPALFGDLLCLAAERFPVIVALEMPVEDEPALADYLASSGDASARAALLALPFWSSNDGRSSAAMLTLIERLRVLHRERRVAGIVAVADGNAFDPKDKAQYERAMAEGWKRGLARHPGARLLALVGNVHALAGEIRFGASQGYPGAASFLPREATVTLSNADVGGTAWMCLGNPPNCAAHPAGRGGAGARGIRKSPAHEGPFHWDYLYAPGIPFTASSPARPSDSPKP